MRRMHLQARLVHRREVLIVLLRRRGRIRARKGGAVAGTNADLARLRLELPRGDVARWPTRRGRDDALRPEAVLVRRRRRDERRRRRKRLMRPVAWRRRRPPRDVDVARGQRREGRSPAIARHGRGECHDRALAREQLRQKLRTCRRPLEARSCSRRANGRGVELRANDPSARERFTAQQRVLTWNRRPFEEQPRRCEVGDTIATRLERGSEAVTADAWTTRMYRCERSRCTCAHATT